MTRKRGSLIVAAVALAAITLITSSSTARTRATTSQEPPTADQLMGKLSDANVILETGGSIFRLERAEFLTMDDAKEVGQTVFFNNRTKQLGVDFVPGDPRRGGRTNISYIVDQAEGAIDGLTVGQTTAAIDRAMATWDAVNCATIPITKTPDIPGLDIGIIESLLGQPGGPFFLADITHAGWLPANVLPQTSSASPSRSYSLTPQPAPRATLTTTTSSTSLSARSSTTTASSGGSTGILTFKQWRCTNRATG